MFSWLAWIMLAAVVAAYWDRTVRGLRLGDFRYGRGGIRRAEHPVGYWFFVAFQVGMGVFITAVVGFTAYALWRG